MFFKILYSYFIGYLEIIIDGYYIERFINICRNKKITIWNLNRNKDIELKFKAEASKFKELCQIAKKTKCKIKIKAKKGLPFFLYKHKKRKIFLLLLIILIGIIFISSIFIWNIEIHEENGNEIENIMQDLEEVGLKVGKLKAKIETKDIINKIRLKRTDIAWMGIELKGTNAIIKIVKADDKPEIIDENEYCNIISNKAGIITKINAQTGTANVNIGDTVNIGDNLINGWMEGKYTGIRYVHAKGEIEAKVWYTKSTTIPYNVTERIETGNIENKYSIKFNNFKINLHKGVSKFKIYDTIETENKMKVFSDFYLPISIIKITNKEIKEKRKTYQIEDAKNRGIEQLQKQLEQEIANKEAIVGRNVNTYEKKDSIEVFLTYEVLENIGTNEKIVY